MVCVVHFVELHESVIKHVSSSEVDESIPIDIEYG